jgi:diglucosylglycerate octanoyltransferase
MDSPRLLVFSDSLSFHGPADAHPADDPRIWPNVAAAGLGGSAELFAGIGWTARDVWWSLTGDPRVWAEVSRADAAVLAVGSMETLPSPLPTYLRQGLRYLRPDPVRRWARRTYQFAQPMLAVALRGRPTVLPAKLTVRYLDDCVGALRALRPSLPIIGTLPAVHRAASYGYVHTARAAAAAAMTSWARRVDVPLLDLAEVVGPHVLSGHGNPDGMHWGWDGHTDVGEAMAALIAPLLPAAAPGPAT